LVASLVHFDGSDVLAYFPFEPSWVEICVLIYADVFFLSADFLSFYGHQGPTDASTFAGRWWEALVSAFGRDDMATISMRRWSSFLDNGRSRASGEISG
jgi:hypothetical protein